VVRNRRRKKEKGESPEVGGGVDRSLLRSARKEGRCEGSNHGKAL